MQFLANPPAMEVMPEALDPGEVFLELGDTRAHCDRGLLGCLAIGVHGLPAVELAAIEFGKESAALPFDLLRLEFGDELLHQVLPERPDLAQLVEHQRLVGGGRLRKSRLEPLQQFLHARRGAFLLLDAILEALDFFLRAAERFLQLNAVAEQVEDAPFVRLRIAPLAERHAHESQLAEALHQLRNQAHGGS